MDSYILSRLQLMSTPDKDLLALLVILVAVADHRIFREDEMLPPNLPLCCDLEVAVHTSDMLWRKNLSKGCQSLL